MSTPLILTTPIKRSARTLQLEGMFDLGARTDSTVKLPAFPVEELGVKPWNVGLIVGPSGAGKTQTARRAFADHWPEPFEWAHDRAVVDEMPDGVGVKEIVEVLSSVGFSSPPAWLRPFHILSNGERFRVEVARALLERRDITVIDEFTSVVDRTVAQVASNAIQKAVRRRGQRLVTVTCHYDVEDWLQPDWTFEPATGLFTWRSVQPRPRVNIELVRGSAADWPLFRSHHYLSEDFNKAARVVLALIDERPVAFCAVLPLPSGTIKDAYRIHRIVTLPDFQGVGVGNALMEQVAGALVSLGKKPLITTSHPGLSASLNRSRDWMLTRSPGRLSAGKRSVSGGATSRNTAGFRYFGPARPEIKPLLVGGALR
jgi:GNAT superfamily N-acetyltransferase